ncbi:MAG: YdeI/OmpD-associated family protein [Pseudomonadota bacterium]
MSFFPHEFEAVIERHGVGKTRKIWYSVLFLPAELDKAFPFRDFARFRIDGEVNDHPVSGAFISAGEGRRYFIVSRALCRELDVAEGSTVIMRFRHDNSDEVLAPEPLAQALEADPELMAAWRAATPGRRRGLLHHVDSAKTATTRSRRSDEASEALRQFGGDLRRWRDSRKA